jgi:branched-chain amino acid transport system ATP-binding protein
VKSDPPRHEPSQGLAPLIVREVFPMSRMREEDTSVLLVEQNAPMSLEIADHAYVLDDGAIGYSGPARARGRRGARPDAGERKRRGVEVA